jgi:hypothetical protein
MATNIKTRHFSGDMSNLDQFIVVVKEYVDLVEGSSQIPLHDFLRKCAKLLPQIYSLGLELPEIDLPEQEPNGTIIDEVLSPMPLLKDLIGKHDLYAEVFDPIILDEDMVIGSLSDDLADIYLDLKRPLLKYEIGNDKLKDIAVWEWKFNIGVHAGNHIVDALRPIHRLIFN